MNVARLKARDPRAVWQLLLIVAFLPGTVMWTIPVLLYPDGLGSHATIYTAAASAWLSGGNPWAVGPPAAVFAGPPPMLVPYVPFVALPEVLTRLVWFGLGAALAVWALRRLRLPPLWLAFPPLFGAVMLGHIEVLILALVLVPSAVAGLAVPIKPYAALPLIADRRWAALALAALVLAASLLVLPWSRFIEDFASISATLARQSLGDSVFGNPVLMPVAIVALASLGWRRALWLAAPVLWPAAQPLYKTMTLPMLTPVLAIAWALPIPGATLAGIVSLAVLEGVRRRSGLPRWLEIGIEPIAPEFANGTNRQPENVVAPVG